MKFEINLPFVQKNKTYAKRTKPKDPVKKEAQKIVVDAMNKGTDAQKFQLSTRHLDIKTDIPMTTKEATLRQGIVEDALATDEGFKGQVKQIERMKWHAEVQQSIANTNAMPFLGMTDFGDGENMGFLQPPGPFIDGDLPCITFPGMLHALP